MAAIRPDEIEPTYLRYFLEANFERLNAATKGSAVPHTDKDLLRGLEVPSYRYNEQRKIASVLYTVDQAIQRTEEIIKQIDTVRKGLIQDLLTGEFNNEKEKTSRVGPKEVEIPNNWVIKRVSDISNIKNGNRIVKGHEYADGTTDYPFIRIVDMENGTVSTEDINYLKEETAKQMQRGIISSDDVYITVTGRVGDAGTIPPELDGARFTDNAAKLYDLEGVIPEYLSLYLRSKFGQDEVHRFTVGSTQPKLSMYRVEKMEVIVPPIDEQEEIVTHVSSIDETRFQNAKIKGKLQRLKQGLMQDLLSGEVRTHDKEIELVEDVLQHG
jgi:type I restriction enzyme S subunit